MRYLTIPAALLLAAAPAVAQPTTTDYATMTCADFLALDEAGQMQAMLEMRAVANGEPLPIAEGGDGAAAPAETDAAPAEADAGAEAGATAAPAPDPDLLAMQTSCAGADSSLAMDALTAAHAE